MTGIVAAAIVAHVPTMGLAKNTPPFQETLVDAERVMGRTLRETLRPDLWVIVSAHWVATFDWLVTAQPVHEGHCVADEAPNLIPGVPYRYRGDPEFAAAVVDGLAAESIPSVRNDSEFYEWDYGTFVPLQHLDPKAEVPVVGLPTVLMSDHAECLKVGRVVHATAKRLGRRAVFLASTALSHVLVRGRANLPTPERIAADERFVGQLSRGEIDAAIDGFADYSRFTGAEMGGRPLATYLGVARAIKHEGGALASKQYGGYAQSSGSYNAVLLTAPVDTLARLA